MCVGGIQWVVQGILRCEWGVGFCVCVSNEYVLHTSGGFKAQVGFDYFNNLISCHTVAEKQTFLDLGNSWHKLQPCCWAL